MILAALHHLLLGQPRRITTKPCRRFTHGQLARMFATDQEQSEPACYSRRVVNEITLRAPSQGYKAREATELRPLARNNSPAPTEPFSMAHEVALNSRRIS